METFCVGDIHGSLNALEQALKRANFNNKKDKLICLGDYVDGWSQSSDVVDFLIELQKESDNRHIFIKGNHDIWLSEWLNSGNSDPTWVYNGGQSTIDSYLKSANCLNKEHQEFFNNLKRYYVDEQNRCFVHAGLDNLNGVEFDDDYTSYWDRTFWKIQHTILDRSLMPEYSEIYIGHTPTINYEIKNHYPERKLQEKNGVITVPMFRGNVINMDTGCGWGGKLSIMNINTKELFQSDKSEDLHFGEKGRKG